MFKSSVFLAKCSISLGDGFFNNNIKCIYQIEKNVKINTYILGFYMAPYTKELRSPLLNKTSRKAYYSAKVTSASLRHLCMLTFY